MANVFKRARKDGTHSWYIRYTDLEGNDVKELVDARTKREAENELANKLVKLADGTHERQLRQGETRFFEIATDFLNYGRDHKRPRSLKNDVIAIEKFKRYFGDLPVKNITESMIQSYIALRRRGEDGFGKQAEPATINRELACLRTIFRRAWLNKKILENPMQGFKLLPEDNVRDRVLTEEEFQKLHLAAPNHLKPILLTAWETGMRRGEILGLKHTQLDFHKGIIYLSGEDTKTKKGRKVPMSPELKKVLKGLPKCGEFVFNFKGKPLRDIRTAFSIACEGAGIVNFRFHDLRHCFVTNKRRKGINDRVIMAITGHTTLECFRRYDTISEDDLLKAVG
jgi:integrase